MGSSNSKNNSLVDLSISKAIAIPILSLILTACGGGSSSTTTSSSSTPASSSSSSSVSSVASCPAFTQLSGTDLLASTKSRELNTLTLPKASVSGNVLVFSKTSGWRHGSIAAGKTMLQSLALNNNWALDLSEDSSDFSTVNLENYDVVVWLNTTLDVLNDAEQIAFESFVEGGGGYVGIHSAADTEYNWAWYGELVGTYFTSHPQVQTALLNIESTSHPATSHLAPTWAHTDEWYNFQTNPRDQVNVLISLDETSYAPGAEAMGDHPIVWSSPVGRGRSFYTGLGHTQESYSNPDFIDHIEGALLWAGRMQQNTEEWVGSPPDTSDFTTTIIARNVNLPMAMKFTPAGELYAIGRAGSFYLLEDQSLVEKSVINVSTFAEGGLIGFTLDPDFANNRHGFFHYTSPTNVEQVVSRITINNDHTLNFTSEVELLRYPTFADCCHVAGDMAFDSEGNLYIATGDNSNPFQSSGYAPLDERLGRANFDAQRTAANTNDFRGKILRIKPTADGSYTLPQGNLFTADTEHLAEIYTMGHRNPFRITIDSATDLLYWGDVGPDANSSSLTRGPSGYDEINKTATSGNFGWPYFAGDNEPYVDYDFATALSNGSYDPLNIVNDSPNNTGAAILPNAIPAWFTIGHRAMMVGDIYRWNAGVTDQYKLPSYFNGRLLAWNFNDDAMYELDVQSETPALQPWVDASLLTGIIDVAISPLNNRVYLLAYGDNCCGSPPFSGALAEVRYIGDGLPQTPEVTFVAGDTISLGFNEQFVSAPANVTASLVSTIGNSEVFELVDAGNGMMALRSISSGLFLSAANNGQGALIADSAIIGLEQQFEINVNQDGTQSFRAAVNCQYVTAMEGANSSLIANAVTPTDNAAFDVAYATACATDVSVGISCRPTAQAFLNMPANAEPGLSNVPALLSQTGAFSDVASLTPSDRLIPYDLIAPLWSDRAEKQRWFSVPSDSQIGWADEGKWQWPAGTVLVKHFELPTDENNPASIKRLETRLIVVKEDLSVYGATYKWRDDNSEADLLVGSLNEDITITSSSGNWTQTWTYPSPEDCVTCHNAESGGILGPKTASLNKNFIYPSGIEDNQLNTLVSMGLFSESVDTVDLSALPTHAHIADTSKTLEHRVRSYWDVNCAGCHGPQGIASRWDARFETPLSAQGVISGELSGQRDYLTDYGLTAPLVVDPGDPGNSILFIRDKSINPDDRMPPIGRSLEDEVYIDVLEEWINSL